MAPLGSQNLRGTISIPSLERTAVDRPIFQDLVPIPRVWDRMTAVERRLREVTVADTRFLTDIAQHLLDAGGKRFRPMMVLLVVMKFVLFMIGLLLFILPGIWIAVRMAFAEFYLVEKREQPVESMRSSFTATEKPFWTIVVVFLVPQVLLILLQLLLKSFVVALGNLFILNVLLHMALVMLSLYITIAFYRIYMQPEGER